MDDDEKHKFLLDLVNATDSKSLTLIFTGNTSFLIACHFFRGRGWMSNRKVDGKPEIVNSTNHTFFLPSMSYILE